MEYVFRCKLCPVIEGWTTEAAAQSAGVWHVYREHHDTWIDIAGTREPIDHLPELLGERYEDWERQS